MILKIEPCEVEDWIRLADVRNQWQVLLYTIMNLRFHERREIYCPFERISAS
jgi:hypothetical protein